MTNSLPYQTEDPIKPHKLIITKEYYPKRAKGMSFFAFIFSIFVYISIFYIFNLSPSTLFKTSKFWFLISNTLILIIAADYGSFSSSKNKHQDVYSEYLTHTSEARRVNNTTTPLITSSSDYEEEMIVKESHVVREQKQQREEDSMQEEKETENSKITPEKSLLQIVVKQDQQDDIQEKEIVHVDIIKKIGETNKVDIKQPRRMRYRRSKSDMPKRVVACGETKNNLISRSTTTKRREKFDDHVEEINEFSTMSDEDLNRRVEEFIQRFNRQIRLQAREDNY